MAHDREHGEFGDEDNYTPEEHIDRFLAEALTNGVGSAIGEAHTVMNKIGRGDPEIKQRLIAIEQEYAPILRRLATGAW